MTIAAAQTILDEVAGKRPEFVFTPDAYAVREVRGWGLEESG
jgi:hypothetical protein